MADIVVQSTLKYHVFKFRFFICTPVALLSKLHVFFNKI